MKRASLLIIAPVLLAALAFAQTPASANTDQTIKGCLGGSEGNYTVTQNNTGHVFKIATSSVDFKLHLGHDVTLTGHNASGASSAADNSLAVTALTMIAEHCSAAAAAPVATVSTLSETAITPPEAAPAAPVAEPAVAPAEAAAPVATTAPVAETVATPPAAVAPTAETVVPPPAAAAPPPETVVTPSERVSPRAARPRRLPVAPAAATAVPDVTATSSSEPVSTPAAVAATPIAAPGAASEPVTTPDAAATTPTAPANHGSLYLLIAFAVFVIVLGILVPSISRWRKQKSLEQTGAPNLSFTREAPSDQDKSGTQQPPKAA